MVQLKVFVTLALAFLASESAFAQNAKVSAPKAPVKASTPPTKQSTTPNWVGPIKGIPTDSACYRKAYIAKNKKCGAGYNFDNIATCWTQCPIEFPVQCGMECIPQNKDCTKEVLTKVMSVANVAINAATSGVFGQLTKAAKGVQIGVMCGQSLFNAVQKIVGYIDEVEKGAKADTTKEQLMFLLGKSDFAVYDLPAAVATCIGIPVPKGLDQAKEVVDVVKTIISKIVDSKSSGKNLLDFKTFLDFTSTIQSVSTAKPTTTTSAPPAANSFAMSTLSAKDQETLKKLVSSGTTCGPQLKSVIDKIVAAVQDLIKQKPTDPIGAMQFAIKNSGLVLVDLPAATVGCWDENAPDGFKTRDDIIKTMHVIIDKIIASASQNGQTVSLGDYALTIADMSLNVIAVFDPTGIAAMAREFVQPICGPTVYVGQIDDGPADKAVGLESMEKAFRNSTGEWKKQGDGKLKLTFKSVDDRDVRVNVMSGGKKLYEVKVSKGQTVEFVKPLTEFQGKTLYLDRWRAGFFGIPGTGGGSLLSWVPDNSNGSLVIEAHINPTSFSDHKRRV